MTEVFYFSGSGHSLAVAEFVAGALRCPIHFIPKVQSASTAVDISIVVFPVYCQNIPSIVQCFLNDMRAKNVVLIATYGKISCGNVLLEAKKSVSGRVIAGVCVPMGHSFLNGDCLFDSNAFSPVFQRIKNPREADIPRMKKNLLANLFPAWRSRVSVKIVRADSCTRCNLCGTLCSMNAIESGRTNQRCIRCLRCVANCPQKALSIKNSALLDKYLSKSRIEQTIKIYL